MDQEDGLWLSESIGIDRENFRNAIYFHLGDLDLYPETLESTHSKA